MQSRLMAAALVAFTAIPAAAQNANPGLRFKQVREEIVVAPDGRRTTTSTSQIQVLTAAAATQFGQLPLPFDGTTRDVEVLDAYTLKADGRKLRVDPANVITQKMPQANALVPLYSDGEQKIVIFPSVEAGDTLVMTSKTTEKSVPVTGQFAFSHYFSRVIEADDSSYSVTVPKAMHVSVSSRDMTSDVAAHGDTTTYRWIFSNPMAQAMPVTLISDPDSGPHFLLSSFKDYDAFAHGFGALVRPKVAATPEIQKQADAITAGITDRKEQTRAIYEWVNQHVRYVGIEFGIGALVPHDANWTLNNGFGDCKDQAVLFASLLKAKNISADLVLIHAGNRYKLSSVPLFNDFNHMIVYLPEWKIYADTTVGTIPFQMLPVPDYGKPVVHLVETGVAQHKTPVLPPDILSSTYKVHAVQNANGRFEVEATTSATGPWAASLHKLSDAIQTMGPSTAAAGLLKSHNFPNATGTLQPVPGGAAGSAAISGAFHAGRPPAGGNLLSLARGLRVLNPAGDGPMGPLNNTTITDTDETPCYSGRQVEDIDFAFANGDHLASVPTDTHIKTDNIVYDSRWTVSGNTAALHREFTAKLTEPTCSGRVRADTAQALAKIRTDYEQQARMADRAADRAPAKAD